MSFFDDIAQITTRQKLLEYYVDSIKVYADGMTEESLASHKTSKALRLIRYHTTDPLEPHLPYPISDMTNQEVYDIAMELLCEAISMGERNAKYELAERLLTPNNPHLTYDKQLGEFLMQVGLLDKELGSCIYFGKTWEIEPNDSIINFWANLFNEWLREGERKYLLRIPPTLGIPLDFKYDRENRKVIFTCVNEKEMLENE